MGTVASDLKSEREKRGISLALMAAETRISLRYLESLEEGRFSDLPGGMYNRAILKAYCEFLQLDTPEIMQRYETEISPPFERPTKSKVHVPQQSSFRISPVFIWAAMLIVSGIGLFFSRHWIAAIFSPYFSHAPAVNVAYSPEKPAQPAAPKPAGPSPAQTPPPVQESPALNAPAPSETLPPQANAPAAAAPALPAPGSTSSPASANAAAGAQTVQQPAPTAAKALKMEIRAREQCWISVTRDGVPVIRKVMEAGEVQSFSAADKFEVTLGNAGGVTLFLNGKPAKSLGKPGEVVKVLINQENLQEIQDRSAG